MLEKILVCMDGSKAAEQIIHLITDDTRLVSSKLTLFRVINLPDITIPLSVPGEPGVPISTGVFRKQTQTREEEAASYLQDVADELHKKGIDANYEVMPGAAGDTIIHYAIENDITLIALGTHGHNIARRFFVGSTADFVIRHSPIPVLVIRPGSV